VTQWLSPAWTVETLIATALLMTLVLAVRGPVQRHFGPRIAYALWLLPALRMILPPLPGWRVMAVPVIALTPQHATVGLVDPVSAAKLIAETPKDQILTTAPMPIEAAPRLIEPAPLEGWGHHPVPVPASSALDTLGSVNWAAIVVALWLSGAVVFFAWQMLRYHRFLRKALKDASLLSRECDIDVLVSAHVSGPVAAGILRRRILLPSDMLTRYSSAERRLALKHEAAHHDRLDILANLVALTIVALHWWNPLAYKAYRAFRADQELACDATVLADAAAGDRLTYGQAVLKSASGRMPVMACALSHKDQLKQRITMMAKGPQGAWRLVCGSMLAVAAVGGGLLITASGQARDADPVAAPTTPEAPTTPTTPTTPVTPTTPTTPVTPTTPRHYAVIVHNGHSRIVSANDPEARAARRVAHDAERQARDAEREARLAGDRAAEAGRRAAEAGMRAAMASQRAAMDGQRAAMRVQMAHMAVPPMPPVPPVPDVSAMVHASLDRSRAEMAARCAAQGVKMPAGADFGALATCGMHLQETIRVALRSARTAIERDRNLTPDQRAHALAGLDSAISEIDREPRHD